MSDLRSSFGVEQSGERARQESGSSPLAHGQIPSGQPNPKPNHLRPVIDAAIEMLESRRAVGFARYGVPLQTGNGRDFGRDADEEMADWLIYWAGYRIEHGERIRSLLTTIGKQQEEIAALKARLDAAMTQQ